MRGHLELNPPRRTFEEAQSYWQMAIDEHYDEESNPEYDQQENDEPGHVMIRLFLELFSVVQLVLLAELDMLSQS